MNSQTLLDFTTQKKNSILCFNVLFLNAFNMHFKRCNNIKKNHFEYGNNLYNNNIIPNIYLALEIMT